MGNILNVKCLMFLIKKATRCEIETKWKYSQITKCSKPLTVYVMTNESGGKQWYGMIFSNYFLLNESNPHDALVNWNSMTQWLKVLFSDWKFLGLQNLSQLSNNTKSYKMWMFIYLTSSKNMSTIKNRCTRVWHEDELKSNDNIYAPQISKAKAGWKFFNYIFNSLWHEF